MASLYPQQHQLDALASADIGYSFSITSPFHANFAGGAIAAGQHSTCEFETRRDANMAQPPRLGLDAIYDVHDYPVLDIRTSNNVLELAPPVVQQIPTLSLRGLLLLAVGVMVGAWTGVRRPS